MTEFKALEEAARRLGECIAEFRVGAVSINDLKPTTEKIQNLRITLKRMSSAMIILRAKEEARSMSNVPERSIEETYNQFQDQMAKCTINNQAVEACLYSDAIEPILHNTKNTEIKTTLQNMMQKLFTLNDKLIELEGERVRTKEREKELTIDLKESLLEFKDFLKEQEAIRNKKLEETNPKIAEQKAQMQKRVEKINMMKRLITNMIAASGDLLQQNPFLQEMMKKHRELVDPEMIAKIAQEKLDEEPA